MSGRERISAVTLAGAYVAVAVLLAVVADSERAPALWHVVLLIAVFAVLSRIEFEIGDGVSVPVQLAFVPMLFVLPLGFVPLAVAIGSVLAGIGAGDLLLRRVLLALGSCWYAVGPTMILLAAGESAPRLELVPVYIAAFASQVLVDALSLLTGDWLAFGTRPRFQLRSIRDSMVLDALLTPVALLAASADVRHPGAFVLAVPLAVLLLLQSRERTERIDKAVELSGAYRGTALLLGNVIGIDDEYTGSHSHGVVDLARAIARQLGLSDEHVQEVEFAALLHDVGKLRVPKEIINKPERLTPEEWETVKRHPVEGEKMLAYVGPQLARVGAYVRAHHERYDGTGYPDGLKGDEIPLIARIIAVCDAYHAMITDRPYRPARSVASAVEELRRCSGSQFDPLVVDALFAVIEAESLLRRLA